MCNFGFHVWVYEGKETYTVPVLGKFDPRDEQRRTFEREMKICARCGRRTEYVFAFDYDSY